MGRRKLDLVVISDVHLGTYGCHAKELNSYLKSIRPKTIILNGDIIDMWQFSKHYFPEYHIKVLRRLMKFTQQGTMVYYITGNHDETLRKFDALSLDNFQLCHQLKLDLDGKKYWFFHGDVFDVSMKFSKNLAKLGGKGYDLLIVLNSVINFILTKTGREKVSFSKKIKDSVKTAVRFINDFEQASIETAARLGFDAVVCGHIHQPRFLETASNGKEILYLNSGDWIENLTALEYKKHQWTIFNYRDHAHELEKIRDEVDEKKDISIENMYLSLINQNSSLSAL